MPTKGKGGSCEGPIIRKRSETHSLKSTPTKDKDKKLWGANCEGKVRNSQAVKSMPTKGKKGSYEKPFARGKSKTHILWRACQQKARRGAMRGQFQGKVRNLQAVKSTPTKGKERSCEWPIVREKSKTHILWRACQQRARRGAMKSWSWRKSPKLTFCEEHTNKGQGGSYKRLITRKKSKAHFL